MTIIDEDVSGQPRRREDIEAALKCITREIVQNPLAMSKGGEPLVMHYLVIKDALQELLVKRQRLELVQGVVQTLAPKPERE
jgi:hypothetical protein